MKFFSFLLRAFSAKLLLAILVSIASGVSMATLVALLSRQITDRPPLTLEIIGIFCAVTVLAIGADLASKWLMMSALGGAGAQLRLALARQLAAKPYPQLEAMGLPRLHALFGEETQQIGLALQQLPNLVLAVSTLLGSLLYLWWLAPGMFSYLALLALPTIGGYWLLQRKATATDKVAQKQHNQAQRYYRALIEGVKELKLHSSRRYAFFTELLQPAVAVSQEQLTRATNWRHLANTWSQSIYFIFILGALALAVWQPANNAVIATYALIILYMKSALTLLLTNATQWHAADVACRQVEALGFTLSTHSTPLEAPATPAPLTPTMTNPLQLALREVVYHYQERSGERSFTLGPLNLAMQSGEVIFLTGDNGSGKTTLIKLLTGLYPVHAGAIYWDGQPVTAETLADYQQLFAVIFTDFYLFDQLLGLDVLDQHAQYYLHKFQIQDKLFIHDGVFSTTELSQGQRKRLALLTAYFENRPIYIFDEWAAGQDPEFREVFYRQLLPELKARGKLVIVSSHDPGYYAVADRVITLDYGQIIADQPYDETATAGVR
ncbi:MAG: cyclic peptide export ABC transporter [Caldilineaceae bacterium]